MEKIIFFKCLVVLISVTSIISCETEPLDSALNLADFQDPNNPNNPNNPSNSALFTVDFDGQTWISQNTVAQVGPNLIILNASIGTSGESFQFLLDANSIGTYPAKDHLVAYTPANSDYGWWAFNNDNPNENTGSVTITEINTVNKTISGNFNFKGYWSDVDVTNIEPKQFTNGVFVNIPYQVYVDTQNDIFYAKVNGSEFVETEILTATINGVLGIGATNAGGQSITVGVNEDITPGTYSITGDTANDLVQATYKLDDATSILANSGIVTITSITVDHIVGTFSFVANDGTTTYTITEGAFDVEY
jgi:hypothetical protein